MISLAFVFAIHERRVHHTGDPEVRLPWDLHLAYTTTAADAAVAPLVCLVVFVSKAQQPLTPWWVCRCSCDAPGRPEQMALVMAFEEGSVGSGGPTIRSRQRRRRRRIFSSYFGRVQF